MRALVFLFLCCLSETNAVPKWCGLVSRWKDRRRFTVCQEMQCNPPCTVGQTCVKVKELCGNANCAEISVCKPVACSFDKNVGFCQNTTTVQNRYFFNGDTQKCELFKYTGCFGNNYRRLEDCQSDCEDVKPEICDITCATDEICVREDVICVKPPCRPLWTCVSPSDRPTVQTDSGILQGSLQSPGSSSDIQVEAYLGVPYAKAPIGPLRFRPPVASDPWTNTKTVDELATSCFYTLDSTYPGFHGAEMWNANTKLTEDCLNMNIWVPRTNHDGTVLVWIYGGGFFSGSPSLDLYDGKVLAAERKVIVININYRLGPFGFLYLGENSEISGNMGMLDQQMALQWIQKNIKSFGGDPNKVTLFGESAGASSVAMHLISPGSKDLFRNAILQSGSPLNSWAMAPQSAMMKRSLSLAEKLKCYDAKDSGNNKQKADERVALCLQEKTKEELQDAANQVASEVRMMEFPFVPVQKDGQFFTENAYEAINKGNFKKCPVLIGTNKDEGSYWLPYYWYGQGFVFDPKQDANGDYNQSPITWKQYLESVNVTFSGYIDQNLVHKAIAFHYNEKYGSPCQNQQSTELRDAVSKFAADFFFTCDVLKFADIVAKEGNPVYSYFFTQRSSTNPWPLWMGVMHGYEIEYVFGVPLRDKNYKQSEITFAHKLMEVWTDFARNGIPTSDWPIYENSKRKYVVLDAANNQVVMGGNLDQQDCGFLKDAANFASKSAT